jgi:hypothetical protein
MSLVPEDQSGVPPILEGENPYNQNSDTQTGEEQVDSTNDEPKSIAPLIAIIILFVLVLGGAAVAVVKFLGGDDKSTSVSLTSDTKTSEALTVSTPLPVDTTSFVEPPLPKITQSEPVYEVVNNATGLSPVDAENISFIISQLNKITDKMDVLDKRLNVIDSSNAAQLNVAKEMAENVVANITTTETIAATLLKQNVEVQQVKTIVSTENNRKKELLSQPPFRVAAVSMWGKTAYLTVESVSDSNFEQQVVVGSTISDWTLRNVDVPAKQSVWVNLTGGTHVLILP